MSTKVIVLYGLSDAQTVWRWIQSGVNLALLNFPAYRETYSENRNFSPATNGLFHRKIAAV